MTVTAAARLLDTAESTIYSLLAANKLDRDPETDEHGKKYVTMSSVERVRLQRENGHARPIPRRKKDMTGWKSLPEACLLPPRRGTP